MALKVELKPHERIIIGNCVVTNTDQRARLLIDGDNLPMLRDIITTMPGAWPIIETINTGILNNDLYRALKEARKLIAYEKELIEQSEAARNQNAA